MTTMMYGGETVGVDEMLAQWARQGQTIAEAIEAERDTLVQSVERDRVRIGELNQKLGEVRLRLGLRGDDAEVPERPIHVNGRAPIVKMTRAAQQMVPVIHRRPAVAQEAAEPVPLHADQFASSTEVITAVLAREPGLLTAELVERCMPLRPAVTRGTWQAMLYHMQDRGKLQSIGKGRERRWSLPVPAAAAEGRAWRGAGGVGANGVAERHVRAPARPPAAHPSHEEGPVA